MLLLYGVILILQFKLPDANKNYNNIDIDDQIFWEMELQPLQDILSIETNWPEKSLQIVREIYLPF